MNTDRYTVEEVSLEAVVTTDSPVGEVEFELPISRYSSVWTRNAIPTAQISIPTGYLMSAPDQVSIAHSPIAEILSDRVKVVIYATIRTLTREGAPFLEKWPADKFVLFEGTAVGTAWQTTTEGNVEFTVSLEHWLSKLTFGSVVSQTFNPQNPSQFTFAAVLSSGAGGVDLRPGLAMNTVALEFISPQVVRTDMWGGGGTNKGIRAFLINMTGSEPIDAPAFQLRQIKALVPQGPNLEARAALERFEPRAQDEGKYQCGVPLALSGSEDAELTSVIRSIAQDLVDDPTMGQLANHTYWDLLLKYAQSYMLAVIPLVDKALLVPYIPTLGTVYKTINAEDYEVATRTVEASRDVRGVGLYGGKEFAANADVMSGAGIDYKAVGIGGYFIDPDRPKGTFLLLQAPPWASDVSYEPWTGDSIGNGGAQPFPTAVNPATVIGGGLAGAASILNQSPLKAVAARVPFMDRLAESIYGAEAVRGRSIDIAGRLRFDICPGSIVQVEAPEENFGDVSSPRQLFFGSVHSVSFILDAESAQVGTSFHIGDVRREGEFKGSLAMANHPLWLKSWSGAPLIEEILCQLP